MKNRYYFTDFMLSNTLGKIQKAYLDFTAYIASIFYCLNNSSNKNENVY